MFELLVRLECKREEMRRRLLKSFGRYDNSYFAIALIVLAASMMTGPLEIVTLPAVLVGVVPLFLIGLLLVLSIVGMAFGLLFW
jgi:hypothetical protein